MKYMLIEVMEREISEPEYFDTHDAAHDEMCRRVAEVYEDIAWAERYGKNYDWKIFAVERGTSTQAPATPLFNTLR